MSDTILHVLVVDDSAVVRHTVGRLLQPSDGWRLTTAPDPVIALDRMRRETPDVILLDLEMPRMDGLTFLRHVMATEPIPVVICSGHAAHGTRLALTALEAGAIDIFPKPHLGVKTFLEGAGPSLMSVLRAAVAAGPSLRRKWRKPLDGEPWFPSGADRAVQVSLTTAGNVGPSGATVLLGASMGGPEALRRILSDFPANGPACVVVQHMPEHFTAAFAARLDRMVSMEVCEASDGDLVASGRVLIARGGHHLVVEGGKGGAHVRIVDGAPAHGHMPSVDVLFESAASVLGSSVVAAVLTGMGNDGAAGLLALADAGAQTLVQDEASCTVFGMPRAALEKGGAQRLVPLPQIGRRLLELTSAAPAAAPGHGAA